MRRTSLAFFVTVFLISLISVGCGDSSSPVAPTPSGSGTSPAPAATGATINGTVMTGTGISTASFRPTGTGLTVTVSGTSITATIDASGHFVLEGVPAGTIELRFTGPSADARLSLTDVAEHEAIQITIRVNGTTAEIEDNHRETTDSRVELEGRITAIDATALSLTVAGVVVTVPSTAEIHHGSKALQFSQLQIGDRVHIHATKTATGVTAREVQQQTEHPGEDDDIKLEGTVSGKTGTCPAITFTVNSKQVTTDSATRFDNATCLTLANTDRVEVKATLQTSGTLLATRVEKKGGKTGERVELEGSISGKTGSCPAITFTVSSKGVSTSSATEFRDTTCEKLANGDRVEVKANTQANGSLLATRVEKKK